MEKDLRWEESSGDESSSDTDDSNTYSLDTDSGSDSESEDKSTKCKKKKKKSKKKTGKKTVKTETLEVKIKEEPTLQDILLKILLRTRPLMWLQIRSSPYYHRLCQAWGRISVRLMCGQPSIQIQVAHLPHTLVAFNSAVSRVVPSAVALMVTICGLPWYARVSA